MKDFAHKMFVALAVVVIAAAVSCKENTCRVLDQVLDEEIVSVSGTEILRSGNALKLTSTSDKEMGFEIKHTFDLSEFKAVRFTVVNETDVPYFFSVCLTESKVPGNGRATLPGRILNFYHLKPYQTRTYEIAIPADLPHPDVDSAFTGMRNTPYARLTGLYSYNADVSTIKSIKMHFRRAIKGGTIVVKDIKGVYGQRVLADKALEMGSDEFFPFVDKYGQFKHAQWPGKSTRMRICSKLESRRNATLRLIRALLTDRSSAAGPTVRDSRPPDVFASRRSMANGGWWIRKDICSGLTEWCASLRLLPSLHWTEGIRILRDCHQQTAISHSSITLMTNSSNRIMLTEARRKPMISRLPTAIVNMAQIISQFMRSWLINVFAAGV